MDRQLNCSSGICPHCRRAKTQAVCISKKYLQLMQSLEQPQRGLSFSGPRIFPGACFLCSTLRLEFLPWPASLLQPKDRGLFPCAWPMSDSCLVAFHRSLLKAFHKEYIYYIYKQHFYGREVYVTRSHVCSFEFPPASAQIIEPCAVATIFEMLKN